LIVVLRNHPEREEDSKRPVTNVIS